MCCLLLAGFRLWLFVDGCLWLDDSCGLLWFVVARCLLMADRRCCSLSVVLCRWLLSVVYRRWLFVRCVLFVVCCSCWLFVIAC